MQLHIFKRTVVVSKESQSIRIELSINYMLYSLVQLRSIVNKTCHSGETTITNILKWRS